MSKATDSPTLLALSPNRTGDLRASGELEEWLREKPTNDGGHHVTAGPLRKFGRLWGKWLLVGVTAGASITQSPSVLSISGIQEIIQHQPVHAVTVQWILTTTGLSKERVAKLLGTSRPTLDSWLQGKQIRSSNRQRLLGVQDVLRRAASRFTGPDELVAWLDTPRGRGGRTPAQILAAGEIDRARALVLSTTSVGLGSPPAWVGRPVAETLRVEEESLSEAVQPDEEADDNLIPDGTYDEDEEWETI